MTTTANCTTVDTSGQIHYICVILHTYCIKINSLCAIHNTHLVVHLQKSTQTTRHSSCSRGICWTTSRFCSWEGG